MAITVLTDAYVVLNSVNLSDHVESVEITIEVDDVDITAMGATAKAHAPGLRTDKISLNVYQDFAAASVDATMYPLIGVQAGFPFEIRPTSGGVSSTNPKYTGTGILLSYAPLAGKVGEASQTKLDIPCQGAITRATS